MGAGWGFDSDKNLARIAAALERTAAAEERRNDILEREIIERKAAWEASEARSERAIERVLTSDVPRDVWADLPESHR